jgi:HEAT repeat protein
MRKAGPWAKAAVPALTKLLEDPTAAIRIHAAVSLGKIEPGNKAVVPALLELMRPSEEISVRQQAILGLRDLGPDARDAIPALREALQDSSLVIRNVAEITLDKINPPK